MRPMWPRLTPDAPRHVRAADPDARPGAPFFQWYYCWARDEASGLHWSLTASAVYCRDDDTLCKATNEGFYVVLMQTDAARRTTFARYDRYPLEQAQPSSGAEQLVVRGADGRARVRLVASSNSDEVQVYAASGAEGDLWRCDGCDGGTTALSWNVTMRREAGWYGQSFIEPLARAVGTLQWNTYAHSSEAVGSVVVNGEAHTLSGGDRYRGYCDMNWGQYMLHAPRDGADEPIDYAWGWYYAGGRLPAPDSRRVSVIAGVGRTSTDSKLLGTWTAAFADVRIIGTGDGDSFRVSGMHAVLPFATGGVASDGGMMHTFDVSRGAWATHADDLGKASIPLQQNVSITGDSWSLELRFNSVEACFNRLLFPAPRLNDTFSDFECLGADVEVAFAGETEKFDLKSSSGGIEFGYQAPISPITMTSDASLTSA